MTLPHFAQVYALLAVQLHHPDVGTATVAAYYRVMRDLPPEFVMAAAEQFAAGDALNRKGEAWFPKAPEWRVLALKIAHDRRAAQRNQLAAAPAPICGTCEDTGWARVAGTDRVTRCVCWTQREAERLGRAPAPLALPAAPPAPDPGAFRRIRAMVKPIAAAKAMPRAWWEDADPNDPILAAELAKRKRSTAP